ncbi:MAG: thioredoxin domain-containing protein [Thermodesulfovibrionales bacterium]|nr:thioredoxin domain-containing protein [Thermodesulfovibrionales bacterium]
MNRLSKERSAYLQHASKQKINWYPWSEEAFEAAKEQKKPVFLSSGAVWCHWCHVMEKESFYNDEIVKLLNEKFICIKLDRDERPDIDKRYQTALSVMGVGGGWPLSMFLTDDRKPFFGGTYFPPDDRFGKPGFKKVLITVAEFYKNNRDKIDDYTKELIKAISSSSNLSADIDEGYINKAINSISLFFDKKNGGFSSAPKFPMPGVVDFLINRYCLTKEHFLEDFLKITLYKMAKGGFHDHLAGGFHRYSTDEEWIIPHFEKMADDNAWLLRNYCKAYWIFDEPFFKKVAEGIVRFFINTLSSADGGFYASQDADVTPDDEGGYFTWTEREIKNLLTEEELRFFQKFYFNPKGFMHHDRSKIVIFEAGNIEEIAKENKRDKEEIQKILNTCKEKLLFIRNQRQAPFVDKSLYTSINGMVITSFLLSYQLLTQTFLRDFALKSLHLITNQNFVEGNLYHSENVKAMLDDYIYLIEAFLTAYEITGEDQYKNMATKLMNLCIERLWDKESYGFFDTEEELLGVKLKLIEDTPHPSANSIAIMLLLKLSLINKDPYYEELALKSLKTFYLRAQEIGPHAGSYFNALQMYFYSLKLNIFAEPKSPLVKEIFNLKVPYISLNYEDNKGYIIPCYRNTCLSPIHDVEELQDFIKKLYKDFSYS